MPLDITFIGSAGTVTGSKYLVESGGKRILIDCGLFQGVKTLRLKNWAPFPVPPGSISAAVLTHAHIDHSGYLPLLVRGGFRGPVFCSAATRSLCEIMLPDSARLQEKDAEFANRYGFSKHKPALPLYNILDADRALQRLRPVRFDETQPLGSGASIIMRHAGHILGAATVEFFWNGLTIVFSGDLGRYDDPLLPDPVTPVAADYLVVESTYGDRSHGTDDPANALAHVVQRTVGRGGTLIIPCFAVGRAQLVLYHLAKLREAGRIPPEIPIYVDSPMATDASEIFVSHDADQKLSAQEAKGIFGAAIYTREPEESKKLTRNTAPKVIISASGMATGGRVLHHLAHYAPDARHTIMFVGYQAAGTRGAAMMAGASSIKIHGHYIPVRAEVDNLDLLSAHADQTELIRWLRGFAAPPRRTFITHGEAIAADALRHRIEEELQWNCIVPEQNEKVRLG